MHHDTDEANGSDDMILRRNALQELDAAPCLMITVPRSSYHSLFPAHHHDYQHKATDAAHPLRDRSLSVHTFDDCQGETKPEEASEKLGGSGF